MLYVAEGYVFGMHVCSLGCPCVQFLIVETILVKEITNVFSPSQKEHDGDAKPQRDTFSMLPHAEAHSRYVAVK